MAAIATVFLPSPKSIRTIIRFRSPIDRRCSKRKPCPSARRTKRRVAKDAAAAIGAHVGPALEVFRFQLHITDVYDCVDPDTLVLEYRSEGHVTTTGKEYRNNYICVVRFRDGLICHQREYYNPVPAGRALRAD